MELCTAIKWRRDEKGDEVNDEDKDFGLWRDFLLSLFVHVAEFSFSSYVDDFQDAMLPPERN